MCDVRVKRQRSFSQTVSGCERALNAQFYSAVSLWFHVPDTLLDITPSHIILTLVRPVLALSRQSECQAETTSTIVNDLGMPRPRIEPGTSRSRSGHSAYCATEADVLRHVAPIKYYVNLMFVFGFHREYRVTRMQRI